MLFVRKGAKPLDKFAALAFALAMLIMIFPLEADLLVVYMLQGETLEAFRAAVVCFVIVFVPTAISWRRHLRQPDVWRGDKYRNSATVILVLNVLIVGSLFVRQWLR